jgi:hypothetical protein
LHLSQYGEAGNGHRIARIWCEEERRWKIEEVCRREKRWKKKSSSMIIKGQTREG